jgi:hypothetical protein
MALKLLFPFSVVLGFYFDGGTKAAFGWKNIKLKKSVVKEKKEV